MTVARKLPLLTGVLMLLAGCMPEDTQQDLEYEAAASVSRYVSFYQLLHPTNVVTNLVQVYADLDLAKRSRVHPIVFQERLRRFGKNAGFKNSFYEKYAFVPNGMTNPLVQGEIVLMNARPFPNRTGELGRIIFSRAGTNIADLDYKWFPENQVQQICRDAGVSIPKVMPLSPPPNPPATYKEPYGRRIARYFDRLADRWSLTRGFGDVVMYSCFALLILALAFLAWLGLRSGRPVK